MLKLRRIDHIVIRTENLDKMLEFYQRVLGATLEKRQDDIGLVQLRAGEALLDFVPVDGLLGRAGGRAPGKEAKNLDHVCLQVDDFDPQAVHTYLAERGVLVEAPAQRYGAGGYGLTIYLKDPDGNTVELCAADARLRS